MIIDYAAFVTLQQFIYSQGITKIIDKGSVALTCKISYIFFIKNVTYTYFKKCFQIFFQI